MEQLYKDPRTPLRMREGPLGAYVDAFAQQLIDEGYARASARYALQLVADLGRWLRRRRIVAPRLTMEHLECYLEYRSGQRRRRSGDAAIVRRLFDLLLDKGVVPQGRPIEKTPAERLEEQFRLYLERERRLAPATVFHSGGWRPECPPVESTEQGVTRAKVDRTTLESMGDVRIRKERMRPSLDCWVAHQSAKRPGPTYPLILEIVVEHHMDALSVTREPTHRRDKLSQFRFPIL